MQVPMSWTEQFLNFLPKTSLYIRGERKAKDFMETLSLMSKVSKEIAPFFIKMIEAERKIEKDKFRERFDMFPTFFSAVSQRTMNGSELFMYNKMKDYIFGEEE